MMEQGETVAREKALVVWRDWRSRTVSEREALLESLKRVEGKFIDVETGEEVRDEHGLDDEYWLYGYKGLGLRLIE